MTKLDRVLGDVIEFLSEDKRGLSIQEIAEKASVSRVTARLALVKLAAAGKIEVRKIGNCKLHYAKK